MQIGNYFSRFYVCYHLLSFTKNMNQTDVSVELNLFRC